LDLTPAVWGQLEDDFNKGIIPIDWDVYDGDDNDNDNDNDDEDDDDERT
jgi:hypothetical protein